MTILYTYYLIYDIIIKGADSFFSFSKKYMQSIGPFVRMYMSPFEFSRVMRKTVGGGAYMRKQRRI